jgi:hypothetical protein
MTAIILRPELQESLESDAAREARTVNDLVNEAVARYVRERQRAKIQRETAAYEAMFDQLARDYSGQWVAVHDGQVIDHDPDISTLYARTRARYGRTSVLIRQVGAVADEDLHWRTPSTGRRLA